MGVIINTAYRVQADLLESESNIKIENGTLHVFDNELKVHLNNEIKNIPTSKYKVYTALLTQTGGDDSVSVSGEEGTINIGVTYLINENPNNNDLTIYGAPNNNEGTYFVANQTGILNYTDFLQLIYNTGAPVVTVLENTIGNIWFTYNDVGVYYVNSSGLFTENKTFNTVSDNLNLRAPNAQRFSFNYTDINTGLITVYDPIGDVGQDGNLINTPIEIRVYN